MRRAVILLLSLLSCSSNETASKPDAVANDTPKPAAPEPPAWLLLPWDTQLRIAPEQQAPALTLAGPDDPELAKRDRGRVIKVVGKADADGRWWKLETVERPQLVERPDGNVLELPIEGLGVYALSLYVPAGTGEPLRAAELPPPEPKQPPATDVELQSGQSRPVNLEKEWQIDPGAQVFWQGGAPAGTVRRGHAFVQAGETRTLDGRKLRCFAIRVGPPTKSATELCFEPSAVRETTPYDVMDAILETERQLNELMETAE